MDKTCKDLPNRTTSIWHRKQSLGFSSTPHNVFELDNLSIVFSKGKGFPPFYPMPRCNTCNSPALSLRAMFGQMKYKHYCLELNINHCATALSFPAVLLLFSLGSASHMQPALPCCHVFVFHKKDKTTEINAASLSVFLLRRSSDDQVKCAETL